VILKWFILAFTGVSYGVLAAAGVFTVLVAVGLVPRFAGKTHTAKWILLYEEMVIFGTIVGCFASIFPEFSQLGAVLQQYFPNREQFLNFVGVGLQILLGLSGGMFVGCLALAIAEMLDSIPIFTRRIAFRHGIGLAILATAIGKVCGSLFYFGYELHWVTK